MPKTPPRFEDGWIVAEYHGSPLATLHMSVDGGESWQPAFVERVGEGRVTKVRPPARARGAFGVLRRAGGRIEELGNVRV